MLGRESRVGLAMAMLPWWLRRLSVSTIWETRVRSLGQEDPLEKEMAMHSSTIAWKIPWTEEPGGLQSMGSQRVGHDWVTSTSLSLFMLPLMPCDNLSHPHS